MTTAGHSTSRYLRGKQLCLSVLKLAGHLCKAVFLTRRGTLLLQQLEASYRIVARLHNRRYTVTTLSSCSYCSYTEKPSWDTVTFYNLEPFICTQRVGVCMDRMSS